VAAMKLMEHFVRYGPPKQILTDRGAQFVNKLVKTVCETYGVNFRTTPIAHSHERNAKVENANLQVLRHLRAYLFDQRVMEDWTRALPAVQFIFNSTIHRDIGYSSHQLLFGPAMNLNRFILEQQTPTAILEGVKWWDEQLELHNNILERAAQLQR